VTLVAQFPELMRARGVPNDESAESAIANQYVGTESEDETGNALLTRGEHGIRKRISRRSLEEQIGWAADLERRVRSKRLGAPQVARVEPRC
jgi:hypothetical protein